MKELEKFPVEVQAAAIVAAAKVLAARLSGPSAHSYIYKTAYKDELNTILNSLQ